MMIMPPRVKFNKEEITAAALKIARKKGIDAVTAREVGGVLGVSSRPIFTWFDSMGQLKQAVYEAAKGIYKDYLDNGLKERVPFLGIGMYYLKFAREEPELYKLLFLTKPNGVTGGAAETLKFSQDAFRQSVTKIYNVSEKMADKFMRDMWFIVYSFATMIVTDDCPYSEEEISLILTEMALSICKGLKEIPGLADGVFDRDAVFNELVKTTF